MTWSPVVCPQCGKKFQIPIDKKTGICPQCQVSLIFEVVHQANKKTDLGYPESYINREELQAIVDEAIMAKSQDIHHPCIQDIAIISTFDQPRPLAHIKKSVDRLLRARG